MHTPTRALHQRLRDELESRTLLAFAANGFGDAVLGSETLPPPLMLIDAATWPPTRRRPPSPRHAVMAAVRRWLARWRQRRDLQVRCRALDALDERTLHDLGIHRCEIRSLAAETAGLITPTRLRARQALRAVPF